MATSSNFEKGFNDLSQKFVNLLPERLGSFRALIDDIHDNSPHESVLKDIRFIVHKIAGSAATFGFEKLGEIALDTEQYIDSVLNKNEDLSRQRLKIFWQALMDDSGRRHSVTPILPTVPTEGYAIKIVNNTGRFPAKLEDELCKFGFDAEIITDISGCFDLNNESKPQLFFLDLQILETKDELAACIFDLIHSLPEEGRIFYFSEVLDFESQLKAVRNNASGFLSFNSSIHAIVDMIEKVNYDQINDPFHVLLIDDDPEQLAYNSMLLQQAGMITSVLSIPHQVIDVLAEKKPDVILMDLYMPECSGLELARLIRMHSAYMDIPIIFVSVEADEIIHLQAIRRGGDDFITKPLDPHQLIITVQQRAKRIRQLRYYLERDSLTGLLNHNHLKRQLEVDLMHADRLQVPVSFVLIDIDHFKDVNDTHGHLLGDSVLKHLSHCLRSRFRRTDSIGRYGGEEFGIILYNSDGYTSLRLIDELRETYKTQEQPGHLGISFSAGIACFPDIRNPRLLIEAADKALYEAKENGRNCCRLSGPVD